VFSELTYEQAKDSRARFVHDRSSQQGEEVLPPREWRDWQQLQPLGQTPQLSTHLRGDKIQWVSDSFILAWCQRGYVSNVKTENAGRRVTNGFLIGVAHNKW